PLHARIKLLEGFEDRRTKQRRIENGRCRSFAHYQKVRPPCMRKCSTIGPNESTGKNVSAPTIKTIETSKIVNTDPFVGNVPLDGGDVFFPARLPAMASTGMIMAKRPTNMLSASM